MTDMKGITNIFRNYRRISVIPIANIRNKNKPKKLARSNLDIQSFVGRFPSLWVPLYLQRGATVHMRSSAKQGH